MALRRGRGGRRHASEFGALVAVLLVVLGVWLGSGRDPGSSTGATADTPGVIAPSDGGPPTSASDLPTVRLADLPPEAEDTVRLIDDGGPYPYERDGITFGNYEALLPTEPHGYYQEFTVPTPGSSDRGARRIIVGQERELYWTADHYVSFQRIVR